MVDPFTVFAGSSSLTVLGLPKCLSPADIVNPVNTQNLILPMGTVKVGTLGYQVEMNDCC
jgi:hypothetical protein